MNSPEHEPRPLEDKNFPEKPDERELLLKKATDAFRYNDVPKEEWPKFRRYLDTYKLTIPEAEIFIDKFISAGGNHQILADYLKEIVSKRQLEQTLPFESDKQDKPDDRRTAA